MLIASSVRPGRSRYTSNPRWGFGFRAVELQWMLTKSFPPDSLAIWPRLYNGTNVSVVRVNTTRTSRRSERSAWISCPNRRATPSVMSFSFTPVTPIVPGS